MQVWSVTLLGVPRARRDAKDAPFQSKKNQAVLASLLLPQKLSVPLSFPPPLLSRQTLAERFWGERKNDPRAYLRQAIYALTQTFGENSFELRQVTVRAAPGAFVTDIDRIRKAYTNARNAPPEERLQHLIEAEGEMRGPFLEGCLRPGDEGETWLLGRRAEVHGWLASILLALADAFEAAGNLNGAMDAARRAVRYLPDSPEAQNLLWRLAEKTGQEAVLSSLEEGDTLERAVARLFAKDNVHLTGKETRLFQALYRARVETLSPEQQKVLPGLALFPAPFSPEIAKQVAGVSRRNLLSLSRTPLVQRREDKFFLPEAIRACAWRSLPTSTKGRLEKRLTALCETWAMQTTEGRQEPFPPPFETREEAMPFLHIALQWFLKQTPTHNGVLFIDCLTASGFLTLTGETVPYLDGFAAEEANPKPQRHVATHVAAHILYHKQAFADSLPYFERALACTTEEPDALRATIGLHFLLGNAYHYSGDSDTALVHIEKSQQMREQLNERGGLANCLRFRAEILNHLGRYEKALQACEEAVTLHRFFYGRSPAVADALFWKASTLFRLERLGEAAPCLEEALSIWQDTDDANGMGFCLRLIGRLRAKQGCFAEARGHLQHAILLHERVRDGGSRLAAMEAMADVLHQEGRQEEALPLYGECLLGYEARLQQSSAERLRKKTQSCQRQA